MRYQSLKHPYAIANAIIAYWFLFYVLFAFRHSLISKFPEILILALLISAALSLQVNLPKSNTQITFLHPFYALSVLILGKLAILPSFLAWLFWVLKGFKEEGRSAFSVSFAVWTPASEAPMAFLAASAYAALGGKAFTSIHDVPWIAFCGMVITWVALDMVIHNTFSGIVHGVPPWEPLLSDLIGYFDVPLAPLAVPVYILYSSGGIEALLFLSVPILMILWLVRRFFEEANKREESVGHLNVAGELIRSELDFYDLIRAVAEKVKEVLGADSLEIFLKDRGEWEMLTVLGKSPWTDAAPDAGFLGLLDTIVGEEPVNVSNTAPAACFAAYERAGLNSLLLIPLYSGEEILGRIVCGKGVLYYFFDYHKDFAKALMGQVSQALLSAKLHAQLVKTLAELRATQDQLVQSEKMAGLGKLAAGVAHEINNPLGAIVINAEALSKELGDRRSLAIILDAARKAKNIVESLLPFSRVAAQNDEVFELKKVIQESLQLWEKQFEESGIRVDASLPENLKISGNRNELSQVITNLLGNARDALMEKGGNDRLVRISADEVLDKIKIQVEDNGCGIPEKNLSKIFEPFFTTKEIGKGTGLGLAVSYALVSAMRGKIEVQSGQGETIFTLWFPKPAPQPQESILDKALKSLPDQI